MTFRKYVIASMALVALAAGAWSVISDRTPQEDARPRTLSSSGSPAAQESLSTQIPQSADVVVNESGSGQESAPPAITRTPPESVEWPANILAFSNREDPDPGLSREMESAIAQSLARTLHPGRFDTPTITCRARSCQILSAEWLLAHGGEAPAVQEWPGAIGRAMRDLNDFPLRDPGTGEALRPTLQTVEQRQGEPARYIAVITLR